MKVVLAQGVSIIRGEVSLHDLVWGLLREPDDDGSPLSIPLIVCCLLRNPPKGAREMGVEILCPDGDGVECVGHGAAPLFPTLLPGFSLALVTVEGLRMPAPGVYDVAVLCDGVLIGQEPLPVYDMGE